MKRLLLFVVLFIRYIGIYSQSVEDGKRHINYQRQIAAENFFNNYLKQQPSNTKAWLLLTKTYLLQKEFQKATSPLDPAPAPLNAEPYFLVAKGAIYAANNKADNSRWYFDRAIDKTKAKNADVLTAVADMEIISGNGDMTFALDIIQKALKRSKNDAALYVLMGNAYHNLHNGGEAFRAYTAAIQKDRTIADVFFFPGELFFSQKTRTFISAISIRLSEPIPICSNLS